MRLTKKAAFGLVAAPLVFMGVAWAAPGLKEVHPKDFDPAHTSLVDSNWDEGLGCPTNAKTSSDGVHLDGTTSDAGCPTTDSKDKKNMGLILAKTGPTPNYAAATAEVKDVKNIVLNELGFDVRKSGGAASSNGSHCGAGALRFNVVTSDGNFYFVGCNSGATVPSSEIDGQSWVRLRWGSGTINAFNANTGVTENISGKTVTSIDIVFDEGSDAGPDNFGVAIVDNIDVNGVLVGQGPKGE
jgi:hypothetical protein